MKQKTNEKGITLIALVITIIVMLILVAVTVTIAMDGGLFTKSKDASDKTKIEAEKETLTDIALGEYDGVKAKVELNDVLTKVENASGKTTSSDGNWQDASVATLTIGTGATEDVVVVKGVKGQKWYAIRQSGTVIELTGEPTNKKFDLTLHGQTAQISLSAGKITYDTGKKYKLTLKNDIKEITGNFTWVFNWHESTNLWGSTLTINNTGIRIYTEREYYIDDNYFGSPGQSYVYDFGTKEWTDMSESTVEPQYVFDNILKGIEFTNNNDIALTEKNGVGNENILYSVFDVEEVK